MNLEHKEKAKELISNEIKVLQKEKKRLTNAIDQHKHRIKYKKV